MTLALKKQNKEEILQKMMDAMKASNVDDYKSALNELFEYHQNETLKKYNELKNETDKQILAQRGLRPLTNPEENYYTKLNEAMKATNPKQALANLDLVMPETVIDAVFEELQSRHELLQYINFQNTKGVVKWLTNKNGYQKAIWGKLCDEITKELESGYKEIDMTLLKLSAFIPVCKAMLDLGPVWLDNYVRQVLYDALANGLEDGIINNLVSNTGPIGMIADLTKGSANDNVVTYTAKTAVEVERFDPVTLGTLIGGLAVDDNEKPREIREVVLIVNSLDYFTKVFPATTVIGGDGTYRNDVFPYPIKVIKSVAVKTGEAVIGLAYRYFMGIGMNSKDGRIEYSDEYQFLEDNRVYLIKLYANGMPMDNNAFARLDISGLKPLAVRVVVEEGGAVVTTKTETPVTKTSK